MELSRHVLRWLSRRRESTWHFALLMGAVFAAVQLVGHLNHEMWRDELHCWAVGRNSTGLADLLTGERRYDGHPFLWYYLLHLVSQVSRSYVALPIVGAMLSVLAALLWLRYAPLPRWLRILVLGSYYLVFEYGVMSRSYTLGLVLVFAFCALYAPYRPRYLVLGMILGLLAATSMYGTVLALVLGGFLFSTGPRVHRTEIASTPGVVDVPTDWLWGMAALCAGLVLTTWTTWPPADAFYIPGDARPVTGPVVLELLGQYWRGLFPYHGLADWNWAGSDALFNSTATGASLVPYLGAAWLVACVVALRRSPRVAGTYALGAVLMAAAQHFIYAGGWRHLGHYFVLFVACVWLHARHTRGRAPERLLYGLLAANVAVQIVTAGAALRTDYHQPFSGSMEAARFIRDHHLQDRPVVADPDDPVTPVAVLLDRPFFFPITGETTDATLFRSPRASVSQAQLLEHARRLAATANGEALLVLDYELAPTPTPGLLTKLIYTGGPAMLNDESYHIYDVKLQ